MGLGRRFFNLARSELNGLLDRAAGSQWADDDEDGLSAFSEQELEEELDRRRLSREIEERAQQAQARAAQQANRASKTQSANHAQSASSQAGGARSRSGARARANKPETVRKAYATLELPQNADLAAVKKAYRALMRKYHPDRFTRSDEKAKTANDLAQRLTQAYDILKRHLS